MALPAPNLDDRRFEDLMADAVRLIRQHCPEWTDQTISDPGMTLVETFAFMTDQLIYRLNRVPDRLHIKFLDLIGVRMFPPTPARADVTFWLSAPAISAMTIPVGTKVGTLRTENADPVIFTVDTDAEVVPCVLDSVRTRLVGEQSTVQFTDLAHDIGFNAFSSPPQVGDELLFGLDRPAPRCVVDLHIDGRIEGIGVDPRHPPLVWEADTGESWVECPVIRDETGGLNTTGSVVLQLPADHRSGVLDEHRAAWIRARVVEAVDGHPIYQNSPTVISALARTVGVTGSATHAEVVEDELLDTAEGVAGQAFRLASFPVLAGGAEVILEVSSDTGWQEWTRVDDFADSAAGDRHFVLDACTGEVMFGPVVRLADGSVRHHGAVPERGAMVRVRRYSTGGGAAGNVPAGAISTLKSSMPFISSVRNLRSAHGGVDGETLDQARARGALTLRTRGRAVTAEDFEVLARQAVPGLTRVRCLAAGQAGIPAGAVKVLVVPAAAADEDGRIELADLVPADDLLARLSEHLDRVRLAGTMVLVEPPRYRGVTVVARLVARPRVKVTRVREQALRELNRYLNPLPGAGPDGDGWPFGRSVRSGDVHGVLQRIQGVDVVEDVRLFTANPVTGERGSETSRIDLEPNSLVFSFEHQVKIESH